MIEPKPLSRDERSEIETRWRNTHMVTPEGVEALLAAERFWREAVRDNGFGVAGRLDGDEICRYCKVWLPENHKPDCSWLLAQESC